MMKHLILQDGFTLKLLFGLSLLAAASLMASGCARESFHSYVGKTSYDDYSGVPRRTEERRWPAYQLQAVADGKSLAFRLYELEACAKVAWVPLYERSKVSSESGLKRFQAKPPKGWSGEWLDTVPHLKTRLVPCKGSEARPIADPASQGFSATLVVTIDSEHGGDGTPLMVPLTFDRSGVATLADGFEPAIAALNAVCTGPDLAPLPDSSYRFVISRGDDRLVDAAELAPPDVGIFFEVGAELPKAGASADDRRRAAADIAQAKARQLRKALSEISAVALYATPAMDVVRHSPYSSTYAGIEPLFFADERRTRQWIHSRRDSHPLRPYVNRCLERLPARCASCLKPGLTCGSDRARMHSNAIRVCRAENFLASSNDQLVRFFDELRSWHESSVYRALERACRWTDIEPTGRGNRGIARPIVNACRRLVIHAERRQTRLVAQRKRRCSQSTSPSGECLRLAADINDLAREIDSYRQWITSAERVLELAGKQWDARQAASLARAAEERERSRADRARRDREREAQRKKWRELDAGRERERRAMRQKNVADFYSGVARVHGRAEAARRARVNQAHERARAGSSSRPTTGDGSARSGRSGSSGRAGNSGSPGHSGKTSSSTKSGRSDGSGSSPRRQGVRCPTPAGPHPKRMCKGEIGSSRESVCRVLQRRGGRYGSLGRKICPDDQVIFYQPSGGCECSDSSFREGSFKVERWTCVQWFERSCQPRGKASGRSKER